MRIGSQIGFEFYYSHFEFDSSHLELEKVWFSRPVLHTCLLVVHGLRSQLVYYNIKTDSCADFYVYCSLYSKL